MADESRTQSSSSEPGKTGGDPVVPNRTPMIVTLVLVGLMVLAVLGYGAAEIYSYARN